TAIFDCGLRIAESENERFCNCEFPAAQFHKLVAPPACRDPFRLRIVDCGLRIGEDRRGPHFFLSAILKSPPLFPQSAIRNRHACVSAMVPATARSAPAMERGLGRSPSKSQASGMATTGVVATMERTTPVGAEASAH